MTDHTNNPGKYDDECTMARLRAGGEVILIVLNGVKGSGFSVQASRESLRLLPKLLREVADGIEKEIAGMDDQGRHPH